MLGELLDRVAAVAEDSLVAVDIGDGGAGRRGVEERRVVGHQAEIVRARS